jgi:hypothetical protein
VAAERNSKRREEQVEKLDLKKARKALFTAPLNRFVPIDVPPVSYLMVDGHGDPNTAPAYKLAVESLYATAYTIKFSCKAEGKDFVVAPLEGLWSARDPESFTARRKDEWDWTMMIMVPDYVDDETLLAAKIRTREKIGTLPQSLRLESLEEGLCLQALHVGGYDDEGPLLAALHGEIMPSGGYDFAGRHHEIYLSDPRKTPPEKLKTVIRQPVRQA